MYTVMISDDGMFSAEYVQPPALSIPLGISGSTVEIRRNEDLTFSAMIGGEWMMITAETTVTAENGNVYAAQLSPEGVPIGVMHVAAMQEVMLGALGGTVTLTQAEDMTWWLGEAEVKDGYVHTAANGNMYVLMMEEHEDHHHWVATYQPVMVMVALGTQGSVELVRAEDMTWWLGSEGVGVGSEVMSDNGNTYTLWYTDGMWTARFEPAMMEIQGTGGVMAYSREADDMYDVESVGSGMTLAADGAGEITTSAGAMYRVMMMDGMLSGVRFDSGAIKGDTVHVTVGLYDPEVRFGTLNAQDSQVSYNLDDRDTAANEANTKVTVAGESISLGDLLGSGMASKAAAASDGMSGEFVNSAVETLTDLLTEAELYAKYQAVAEDDAGRGAFDARLTNIAERAQGAVNMIFGTHHAADTDAEIAIGDARVDIVGDGTLQTEDPTATNAGTNYIRATHTVRGLNRLLDALSSADAFVDATKDGNNGVFENALNEDNARKAFSANKSEYMVYLGTTQNTRYGAIALKDRRSAEYTDADSAVVTEAAAVHGTRYQFDGSPTDNNDIEVGKVGAFSYATVNDTLRARNLPQTGGAVYRGGTMAATPAGTLYSGDMRVDVNFRQQSVLGRVSDLRDKDNNPWKYLDSDVATIYLPRQNYSNLTQFGGGTGNEDSRRTGMGEFGVATVVYADSQGFSSPTQTDTNARFAGRFIGTDGGEITGTWSLGQPEGDDATKSNDLDVIYGSYGVTRIDGEGAAGPADGSAGGVAKTTVVHPGTVTGTSLGATFAGDLDAAGILRLGKRSTGGGNDANNDFDLTRIFAQPGANPKKTNNNSPKHSAVVVEHIQAQRAIYVIYAEQVGGDSADTTDLANQGRQNAWASINNFVRDHIFDLPTGDTDGLGSITDVTQRDLSSPLGTYMYPTTRNGRPDDDAALERIDALLAAFADQYAFADALKDDSGGVFDSQPALDAGATQDPFPLDTENDVTSTDYSAEPAADIFNRLSSQTQLFSLSTDYTRFGVWFRRETDSAVADWSNHASPDDGADTPANTGSTSPGSYAYSWLSQSAYRTDRDVATYPSNGLATYEGKTLALIKNTHIYIGDALIRVNWNPLLRADDGTVTTQSTVVPIFSNFRKWQDGSLDRLLHVTGTGNDQVVRVVDEIVFPTMTLTEADGQLQVVSPDAGSALTVTFTDRSDDLNVGVDAANAFNGKFVGSSGDGPLGILGTWSATAVNVDTNNTATDAMVGSFGADLTSFETLLP